MMLNDADATRLIDERLVREARVEAKQKRAHELMQRRIKARDDRVASLKSRYGEQVYKDLEQVADLTDVLNDHWEALHTTKRLKVDVRHVDWCTMLSCAQRLRECMRTVHMKRTSRMVSTAIASWRRKQQSANARHQLNQTRRGPKKFE